MVLVLGIVKVSLKILGIGIGVEKVVLLMSVVYGGVNLIWPSKFEFAALPVYDGVPVGVSAPCALWMADAIVTRRHLATGVGSLFTILL